MSEVEWAGRVVVLLVGPPGAGKTTAARASGLRVFDRDDTEWVGEKDFSAALDRLGGDRSAQAVVIRWGASAEARAKTVKQIRPTHMFVVSAERGVCARRITERGRSDARQTLSGLNKWFSAFDRADGIKDFVAWASVAAPDSTLGSRSREW